MVVIAPAFDLNQNYSFRLIATLGAHVSDTVLSLITVNNLEGVPRSISSID